MLRDDEQDAAPLPPCTACGEPAPNELWGAQLCDACSAIWSDDAPVLTPLELAHADAHPEDVEVRGTRIYLASGETDGRWVLLRPGVTERLAGNVFRAWLQRRRSKARAA